MTRSTHVFLVIILALLLAGCGTASPTATTPPDVTTPPGATEPPSPLPTPEAEPPSPPLGPDTGEAGRPPAVTLRVGEQEQVAGTGSYCWTNPGTGVGVCADAIGIITPSEPLEVSSPFEATLELGLEVPPSQVALRAIPVTASDAMDVGGPGSESQAWRPGGTGRWLPLDPARSSSLEISLDPGLYVLDLQASWANSNSASYGFLVQVTDGGAAQAGPGSLIVEETPIVSDAEDRPTHLEYMERIGSDVLDRRRAWREPDPQALVAEYNELLAPFGYRLEAEFNAEWGMTFYDLYHGDEAEPLLLDLMRVWRPSVSASGDDFVMAAENAPNVQPTNLLISAMGPMPWQAMDNNMLPPAYLGDEQAAMVATPGQGIDMEYSVWVGGREVYSGTAPMMVSHPVQGFVVWDEHWALELEDRVIVDGEDLGQKLGYNKVFGFQMLNGKPFYFYETGGTIHLSYDGETLPQTYNEVPHNQCCEPAMFNPRANEDMVAFHGLRAGTWYYVEAGVFD